MARSNFQKLKILYIMDYLLRCSDEEHPVSVSQIIAYLGDQGIQAERKSIYDDLEALQVYGLDIIKTQTGRATGYYAGSRDFELPELKLLVDSVQSSKFITRKKTMSLIKKIEGLASVHQAQALNRQVFVTNRIKTMNESIYYNVDEIHTGISLNRKIRFHYFEYTVEKQRHLRRDGAFYCISPFALTWDDENYYLVGFESETALVKHFRVDKMMDIEITDEVRDGMDVCAALDLGVYARKVFGMFSGQEMSVRMRFDNRLVGVVLDRLGRDVMLVADGDAHFTVQADVVVSPQFFAWLCGFGTMAKLLGPESVVRQMQEHVQSICQMYET